jgi:hypothetical protein
MFRDKGFTCTWEALKVCHKFGPEMDFSRGPKKMDTPNKKKFDA